MPNLIPGIDLSLQRQSTTVQAGVPLLISGRISVLGVGPPLPALIRVFVEGPAYEPSVRHFDTFSTPFAGDYSVTVLAEKDGEYEVYAKAYPASPILPFFGEPLILGPAIGESPKPPIVVGTPTDEGLVQTIDVEGILRAIPAPPPVYVDVAVPVVVETKAPTTPAAPVVMPPPPPDIPLSELPKLSKQGYVQSISFDPNILYSGGVTEGTVVWENTGGEDTQYDVMLYLIDTGQQAYGPFQISLGTLVPAGDSMAASASIDTSDLPDGQYTARADVKDAVGGTILASRTLFGPQILETPITDINVTFPLLEGEPGQTLTGTITWEPV